MRMLNLNCSNKVYGLFGLYRRYCVNSIRIINAKKIITPSPSVRNFNILRKGSYRGSLSWPLRELYKYLYSVNMLFSVLRQSRF